MRRRPAEEVSPAFENQGETHHPFSHFIMRTIIGTGIVWMGLAGTAWAQPAAKAPAKAKPAPPKPATVAPGSAPAALSTTDEPPPFLSPAGSLPMAPVMFYSATLSPDDRWIAGGTSDWTKPGQLLLWDVSTRKLKYRHQFALGVRSVAFSPNSSLLAAGTFTNEILVLDIAKGKVVAHWKPHTGAVNGLAFSQDGQMLASASLDRSVRIWNVELPPDPKTGLPLRVKFDGHKDWVFTVAFGHDGKTLFSGGRETSVFVWDVEKKSQLTVWKDLAAGVEFLTVSPKGDAVALGMWNGTVELRDPKTGVETAKLTHLENNQYTVSTVAFSKDGKWLASAASDGTAKLWEFPSGKLHKTIPAHVGRAWAASPTSDAGKIMTAGTDGNLCMWDVKSAEQLFQLPNQSGVSETASDTLSTAWSGDHKVFATAHADQSVRVRDMTTGQSLKVITAPVETRALVFSPDGRQLAGAGQNRAIYLWDISADIKDPVTLRGHEATVTSMVFTPDNLTVFAASEDGAVRQWDIASNKATRSLDAGKQSIYCLALSSDGRWLAAGGQDRTIRLWDTNSTGLKPAATLPAGASAVRLLAFAPRQPWLASAGRDTTISLWNIASLKVDSQSDQTAGINKQELAGHQQPISSLSFSPGGNWLATGSADKSIRIWDVRAATPGQVLIGTVASRALTLTGDSLVSIGSDHTLTTWQSRKPILFPAAAGRFVKLKALSAVQAGDPFASAAEIVLLEDGRPLKPAEWKLVSVDSEDLGNEGTLAFDGKPHTFWHTKWRIKTPEPQPHEIIIDLGRPHRLSGLYVLPRTDDSANGTIKDYEFYVGDDAKKFGPAAAKGTLQIEAN